MQKKNGLPVAFIDFKVCYWYLHMRFFLSTVLRNHEAMCSRYLLVFYDFLCKWIRKLVLLQTCCSLCGLSFRDCVHIEKQNYLFLLLFFLVNLINSSAAKNKEMHKMQYSVWWYLSYLWHKTIIGKTCAVLGVLECVLNHPVLKIFFYLFE